MPEETTGVQAAGRGTAAGDEGRRAGRSGSGGWAQQPQCPSPPGPRYRNPEALRGVRSRAVPTAELCEGRRRVGNPPRGRALSPEQLLQLRTFLDAHLPREEPLTIDALVTCKVILGRWPLPAEMRALYGDALRRGAFRLFKKEVRLRPRYVDDPPVQDDPFLDWRLAYIIGSNGTMLDSIAHDSGCLFIWIKPGGEVSVHAAGADRRTAGRRIDDALARMDAAWRRYVPWPRTRSARFSKGGLEVVDPYAAPVKAVSPTELYHIVSR